MGAITARRASWIAYLAAAANALAALVMLIVLRPGVPAGESELLARMDHVATNVTGWRLGWFTWNLAAASLLAFYLVLARRWRERAPIATALAVTLAAAGLAADIGAESLLMIVLPGADPDSFALIEEIAFAMTGYVANGLYTVAGILLTVAGASELPRPLVGLGALAWASGLGLSITTLVGSEGGQFVSTAVLMPLFIAWTVLVGRWLATRAS